MVRLLRAFVKDPVPVQTLEVSVRSVTVMSAPLLMISRVLTVAAAGRTRVPPELTVSEPLVATPAKAVAAVNVKPLGMTYLAYFFTVTVS